MSDTPKPPALEEPWVIVLQPLPGGSVPVAIRVRHLLKRALRDWDLKCVIVRNPTPEEMALADIWEVPS